MTGQVNAPTGFVVGHQHKQKRPIVQPTGLPGEQHLRQPIQVQTSDLEEQPMKYVAMGLLNLHMVMGKLAGQIGDKSLPFDEHNTQTLAPEAFSNLIVQPEYEGSECVEKIIVTGPASQNVSGGNVVTPSFPVAGQFRQNANPFPVNVTFNDGSVFNVFGGGAGNSGIGTAVSGPVTFTLGPYQAIGWNTATVAPTNWTWTGIENATVQLQLGDRVWNLVIPSTGILVIAPVAIRLARTDPRVMTASIAGEYSLELMGYADSKKGNF